MEDDPIKTPTLQRFIVMANSNLECPLQEIVSDDGSFADNSDKTITEVVGGAEQDLEGFFERGDTQVEDDENGADDESGAGTRRPGPRGNANEEFSLGLSEMRMASLSQGSPLLPEKEQNGEGMSGVMDWRRPPSPIRRPGRGSFASSRGSTVTPGGGLDSAATRSPSFGRKGRTATFPPSSVELCASGTSATMSKISILPTSEPVKSPRGGKMRGRAAAGGRGSLSSASPARLSGGFMSSEKRTGKAAHETITAVTKIAPLLAGSEGGKLMNQESEGSVRGKGKGKRRATKEARAAKQSVTITAPVNTADNNPKRKGTPHGKVTVPDPLCWIQKRFSASKGDRRRGGTRDVADGERDDMGTPTASASSQNILAIGVPVERRLPGTPPCDPAPNSADEGLEAKMNDRNVFEQSEGAEEHEVLAATPAALNTQDINPGNSSQVLKDCSQQRRKTDRDLDEAIAAALGGAMHDNTVAAGAAEVASCVRPSNQPSLNPVHKGEAVNIRSIAAPTPERLSTSDHGSHEFDDRGSGGRIYARKTGKRKEMKPSVKMAAVAAMRVEKTPIAARGRGRVISRTPSIYLGSSASKTSARQNSTLSSPPLEGGVHRPASSVFDIPSEEEEGNGADIIAAALTRTHAERLPGAHDSSKSSSSPRTQIGKGKGKRYRAENSEPGCGAALKSGFGSRENRQGRNGSPVGIDDVCESRVSGTAAVGRELNGDEDTQEPRTQDRLMERTMAATRELTTTPVPSAHDHADDDVDVGGGGGNEDTDDANRKSLVSNERPVYDGRGAVAVAPGSTRGESPVDGERRGKSTEDARRETTDTVNTPSSLKRAQDPAGTEGRDCDIAAVTVATSVNRGLLDYHNLCDFLRQREGWKQVAGLGLHGWVWIMPGSRKGKKGKAGVDFLTSDDLIGYVCRDKGLLECFEAFVSKRAGSTTMTTAAREDDYEGKGVTSTGDGGRDESLPRAGDPGALSETDRRSRGKKRGVGARGRGSRKVGRKSLREGAGKGEKTLSKPAKGEVSLGRLVSEIYKKLWPDLQKQGWRWVKGSGLQTHVCLKKGVTKRDGTRGFNMFESMDEVVEHVLGLEALGGACMGGDYSRQRSKVADDGSVMEEWGLTKFRSKRRRFSRIFLGGTPAEVEESGTDDGAPSVDKLGSVSANGDAGHGEQTPGACRSGSDEASNVSPPAGGGEAVNAAAAAVDSAQQKERWGQSKRSPPPPAFKRRRTARDDSSRRKLPDGEGDVQRDAMADDEILTAADGDEDDADLPTQPQFELSTAINMIEAGRSRCAEEQRAYATTSAVSTTTTSTGMAGVKGGTVSPAVIPFGAELLLAAARKTATSLNVAPGEECGTTTSRPIKTVPSPSSDRLDSSPVARPQRGSMAHGGASGNGSAGEASPSVASSPVSTSVRSRRGCSPKVGSASRASSARRPFSGLGFIVTGIRNEASIGKTRQEIETSIKTMGGTVVDVFDIKNPANAEWVEFLLQKGGNFGQGSGSGKPPRSNGSWRMIAVSAPDGDRLPKVQVALAARLPIVHASYVAACVKLGQDVGVSQYLLPFGRSALGDNGLVMPGGSGGKLASVLSRDHPFQGRNILYYPGRGVPSKKQKMDTWEFTLRVAGATVITIVEEGGNPRIVERRTTEAEIQGSKCNLEVAMNLLEKGQFDCVIGPNNDLSQASRRLDATARRAGTMAGTVEWASQCLIHARLLVPHVGTCPWFPLIAAGGGGGDYDVDGGKLVGDTVEKYTVSGTLGCKRKKRKDPGHENRGSCREEGTFYVLSGSKRYVVGDYAFLRKGNNDSAAAAGVGGDNGNAADLPQVVRIMSFERGRDRKVAVEAVKMNRCDGRPEVLVEGASIKLPEGALDSRVLVMSQQQMLDSQAYSLNDKRILCRDDEEA